MASRNFLAPLCCQTASDAADVRSEAGDTECDSGVFVQPFVNAFHALSSLKGGIDFRPERLDLTGLRGGLFRATQREAGARSGDPVVRVFCFAYAGQKNTL